MDKHTEQLESLSEIRSLMERSSRFISLSGLSGIFAGLFALAGAAVAYKRLDLGILERSETKPLVEGMLNREFVWFFIADAAIVLILSLAAGIYFTTRKAKKQGLKTWDNTAKRTLINLILPLGAGGIFCLLLLMHNEVYLIGPATLIFYGLALLNAGKYTLNDIRYLGVCQIVLGLVAMFLADYPLLFWAMGFGVLHIVYGILMYSKYER